MTDSQGVVVDQSVDRTRELADPVATLEHQDLGAQAAVDFADRIIDNRATTASTA